MSQVCTAFRHLPSSPGAWSRVFGVPPGGLVRPVGSRDIRAAVVGWREVELVIADQCDGVGECKCDYSASFPRSGVSILV